MKFLIKLFILVILLQIIGCNNNTQTTDTIDKNTIIATYPNDNITINELQDYIVFNSIKLTLSSDDLTQKYIEVIKNLAIEKQILLESKLSSVYESPQLKLKKRDVINKLHAQQFLSKNNSQIAITDDEIENFYKQNFNKYNVPEIRYVYHFFKSNINKNANNEIERIRNRIISGESFKSLAEKYSDSESRHTKGFLGQVKKGDFSLEFDKIIFNLGVNELSPILKTNDGYHMFLVTERLIATNYEINEIRNIIHKDLLSQKSIELLKNNALSLKDLPTPMQIVKKGEFYALLKNKSYQSLLYNIGSEKMTVYEFYIMLQELTKIKPNLDILSNSYELFEESVYSEIIYQHMLKENISYNQPKLLNTMLSKFELEEYYNIKLKSYINKHPELITTYFNSNKMRYVTPIKQNIKILKLPIISEVNIMPELEASVTKLNNNTLTLAEMASKYNGTIITTGLIDNSQLYSFNKDMSKYLSNIEINEHTPPLTSNGFYYILKLIEKTKSENNPLQIVREKVVKDYIQNYKAQIFIDMRQEYIKNIDINKRVLESYIMKLKSLEDI